MLYKHNFKYDIIRRHTKHLKQKLLRITFFIATGHSTDQKYIYCLHTALIMLYYRVNKIIILKQ